MTSERAQMLAGELYDPTAPELEAERKRARELTREYDRTAPDEDGRRLELLEELLGSRGEACTIEPSFRCDYGSNIHVGEGFFANFDCVFLDVCRIEIGRNCLIGPGVHIYTATHPLEADERAEGLEYGKPVTIGDDVVVGSGAVVTEDVPQGVVVQGNPATVVRELESAD